MAVAAVIIWLGPLAEWYVEKYDMELVGRRIEIDIIIYSNELSQSSKFSCEASVDNITLYEDDNNTHFAHIDHAELEIDLGELVDNHIYITRGHFVRPYMRIDQNVEEFNFDDTQGQVLYPGFRW